MMITNFYTFLITYIYIICSVLGYGILICYSINRTFLTKNIGYVGLVGIFFFTIYSYFSSLFISHSFYHNIIFLSLGFLIFIIKFNFFNSLHKNSFEYFAVVFGVLLIGLFIFKTHDDFLYYHFQYSYYLTQQPAVIGIGNFGLGLRTPSSLFYLNSLFYLPLIKYFSFQITPVLILGFSNLILLIKIKNDIQKKRYNFITIFNLLVFIFINSFFYRISEHGTDRSAQILILILISEILFMVNFKTEINKSISKLFVVIGLVISFKAFYVLYGIFFFIITFHLLQVNKKINEIFNLFVKNFYFIGFFFLFFLILLHNFLISGCLIYPVSFTCFESVWAININEVKDLNNWYEQWSKGGAGPNFRVEDPLNYIKGFNWVSNWIDIYFFNKVSDFLLGLFFVVFVYFFMFRSNTNINNPKRKINLLVFFIFILLFEWFYNHPALRYGGYCLIASVAFVYFSIFMERYEIKKKLINKRIYIIIFITALIFTGRNIDRIQYEVQNYKYQPLKYFYYKFDEKHFEFQNKIKKMVSNYEACKNLKKECEIMIDQKINIDKIYGKYVFYPNK